MGQQEVMDILEKFKDSWFTSQEVAKMLNVSKGSVGRCLKLLRIRGYVKYNQQFPIKYKHKG